MNYQERRVNAILDIIQNSKKLSKEEGFAMCREYLIDHQCALVIFKVIKDTIRDEKVGSEDLQLDTIYVANIYQGRWRPGEGEERIFAQSLQQMLNDENNIENAANYCIEWMIVDV